VQRSGLLLDWHLEHGGEAPLPVPFDSQTVQIWTQDLTPDVLLAPVLLDVFKVRYLASSHACGNMHAAKPEQPRLVYAGLQQAFSIWSTQFSGKCTLL
jgi:hypothetical protein